MDEATMRKVRPLVATRGGESAAPVEAWLALSTLLDPDVVRASVAHHGTDTEESEWRVTWLSDTAIAHAVLRAGGTELWDITRSRQKPADHVEAHLWARTSIRRLSVTTVEAKPDWNGMWQGWHTYAIAMDDGYVIHLPALEKDLNPRADDEADALIAKVREQLNGTQAEPK